MISVALRLGLTGNIACGKSALAELFVGRGIKILDSDEVVRELYISDKELQAQVLELCGTLDKAKIAAQVFAEAGSKKREQLEAIVHPKVNAAIETWFEEHKADEILVNVVPLLFEAQLEDRFDKILAVTCDLASQKARLRSRNPDMSEAEIEGRIAAQMPQSQKASKADYIIDNSGSEADLKTQFEAFLAKLSLIC